MLGMGKTQNMSESLTPFTKRETLLALCCGLGLALVLAYHASMDPLVRLLGVAHADVVNASGTKALLVDHLASADAPMLQALFQGEIWGRHSVRGAKLLLPMLTLGLALAGLLALALPRWRPVTRGEKAALPSALLGIPLFLGACGAALWPGTARGELYALFPWLLSLVAVVGTTQLKGRSESSLRAAFAALTSARWLWLGFLLLSPTGFFRWEQTEGAWRLGLSTVEVSLVAGLVWALHRARTWCGELEGVSRSWTKLCFGELWLVLPTFGIAAAVGSLNSHFIVPYLLTVLTSCLMLGWARSGSSAGPLAAGVLSAVVLVCSIWATPETVWQKSHLPASSPTGAAQKQLKVRFGHQVRLGQVNGTPMLVSCGLDLARQSEALGLATAELKEQPRSVNVRTRRGERTARFILALTVTLFLVVPTFLLTVASSGRRPFAFFGAFCTLAGLNGAFAVTAVLGWFWLDPASHFAGMVLASIIAWMGLGYARDWVDNQISKSVWRRVKS